MGTKEVSYSNGGIGSSNKSSGSGISSSNCSSSSSKNTIAQLRRQTIKQLPPVLEFDKVVLHANRKSRGCKQRPQLDCLHEVRRRVHA
jgi:hypothetical protein